MAIKSKIDRLESRFTPIPFCGCYIWTGGTNFLGYGKFDAYQSAHRASWEIYKGEIPKGMHVLHKCDVRCCVNPDHLFTGSHSDNMKDMWGKGRHEQFAPKGWRHWKSRLNEEKVKEIRNSGLSNSEAGRIYGVSHKVISAIRLRTTWRHV